MSQQTDLFSAAGDLDSSFGIGGKVTTDRVGPNNDFAYDAAIQPDGKIVLAGTTYLRDRSPRAILVRLLPDGTLDPAFGNGGKVIADFISFDASFHVVMIQSDGRILAAGTTGTWQSEDFLLTRFNTDGTPDLTFGTNGIVIMDWDEEDSFNDLAIQPDGRIVAVGNTGYFSFDSGHNWWFAVSRFNTDGSLDVGFGDNGKVLAFGFNESGDSANAVRIQPDGKIVVAGNAWSSESYVDFGIARFNPDGSFDSSFGQNGGVLTDFAGFTDSIFAIAIQSDGKIVAAGEGDSRNSRHRIILARYDPQGNLDAAFGSGGKVVTKVSKNNMVHDMVLQSDGRILVGGGVGRNQNALDFAVLRYNNNGSIDTSFGSNGVVRTDFGNSQDEAHSLLLTPNGSILAVGNTQAMNQSDLAAVLYDISGNIDKDFGIAGKLTISFVSSGIQHIRSVRIQPDGKIVAAGIDGGHPNPQLLITRYLPDGTLDSSFGVGGATSEWIGEIDEVGDLALLSDGKLILVGRSGGNQQPHCVFVAQYNLDGSLNTAFGSQGITCIDLGIYQGLSAVSIQPDGKIVGVGFVRGFAMDIDSLFLTVRFNPDGTLDNSFGSGGIVTTSILSDEDQSANAVAIQPDGRIVVAGYLNDYGGGSRSGVQFALVRYNTDGTLDPAFGSGGIVRTNISTGGDAVHSILLQQDGKIIAGGFVNDDLPGTNDFALVRYLSDGSLDPAFGNGGIVRTDFSADESLESLAIQSDGKIVAAGYTGTDSQSQFGLARYNIDGSLDASFGTGGRVITSFGSNSYAFTVAIQSDGKIVAGGSADTGATFYDFALARYDSSAITLLPATLPNAIPGIEYDQTITATGGTEPYTYSLINGNLPSGLTLSSSGVISGTPAEGGNFLFTVQAVDAMGIPGSRTYTLSSLLLLDDFEDGIFTWNVDTPDWEEAEGSLVGRSGWAFAPIPWIPSGANGCSICSVEADIQTSGGLYSKILLIGWYQGRANRVELILDEQRDRWILQQRSEGAVVARKKVISMIERDIVYHVKLQYDGISFNVWTNGALIISLTAGANPFGNFGFHVRNAVGTFSEIRVY